MTEARFRDTWGKLARAVLDRAFSDLDPTGGGFSKKWQADAHTFFKAGRYTRFADQAGITCEDIEKAYELRSQPAHEKKREGKRD